MEKFYFLANFLINKTRSKFWGVTTLPPLRKISSSRFVKSRFEQTLLLPKEIILLCNKKVATVRGQLVVQNHSVVYGRCVEKSMVWGKTRCFYAGYSKFRINSKLLKYAGRTREHSAPSGWQVGPGPIVSLSFFLWLSLLPLSRAFSRLSPPATTST